MDMLRSIRSRGLMASALGILVALPLTAPTAAFAAQGGSKSLMSLVVTTGQPATVLWQKTIAGGDAAVAWKIGDSTVTAAALPGATVTVTIYGGNGQAGGAEASVSLPPVDKTRKDAAERATYDYAASGRSVQSEALAVGYSAVEAAQISPQLSGSPTAATTSDSVSQAASTLVGTIIGSACANVTGDGGHAYGKACIIQTLMQQNGLDWYIGDEITSSANDSGSFWKLTGLQAWDTYGSGNTIVRWKPSATYNASACSNVTYSLSYNGIGISASDIICPDRVDPKFWGNYGYGTNWTGCDVHQYVEGAPSVDLDHNPPNASPSVTVHVYIWWNCF